MSYLGIDPGLDGAFTLLRDDGEAVLRDLPTIRDEETGRRIDGPALARELTALVKPGETLKVCLEKLAAGGRTGENNFNSVGSQFWTQGAIVTTLELLGLQVDCHVAPVTWKGLYGLAGKRGEDARVTKRLVRERAAQLYPMLADQLQRQGDHNRAESALIAHWFKKVRG